MQEKLLILREKRGYTKKYMGEYLGISYKQYSKKERGINEFTSDEMFKIGDLFGMSIADIFLPRCNQNGDKEAK